MDEIKDPLLETQENVSSEGYQYSFVALPERITTIVAAYIQLIWKIKNFRKSVSPEQIIQNSKAMFEINARTAADDLWKEHCAGSLRELVDCHITADFTYVLKFLPNPTNNKGVVEVIYGSIQTYKEILNELAHLNKNTALQKLKTIEKYNTIESIDNQTFDKICTEFILLLHSLFRNNCMKGD